LSERTIIASSAGIAFVAIFPFVNWAPLLLHVPASGIMMQFAIATALGVISFGINRRSLGFFHIRGIGRRDLAAASLALFAIFAIGAAVVPILNHFATPENEPPAHDIADYPFALALATALTAGLFEEFIYRGFVLEELGELLHNRYASATVSVVLFALAHYVNAGWSLDMIIPGLAGIVLTVLYLRRGNLTICILLHATIDSLHVLLK
jgi:membrane protease YdiL (CAAX protease family)